MFFCTLLKMHPLIKERAKYIPVYQAIWSLLPVNCHFSVDTKGMFHSCLSHNLWSIILKRSAPFISAAES